MNPQCAQQIQAAAGRTMTKGELDAIEQRIIGSLRELSAKDPATFQSMPRAERMNEAVKLAKENLLKDVVAAHERAVIDAGRVAQNLADLGAIKPGKNGAVQWVKTKALAIEQRTNAIATEFFRRIAPNDTTKFFGTIQDPAKAKDFVAAIFKEQSSPEAAAAARTFQDANKAMTDFYRAEGLPLHELDNWNLPQPQDPAKVATAGKDAWVDKTMGRVDPKYYVNPDGTSKSPTELREFLGKVYDTLSTDGANKRAEGEGGYGGLVGGNANAPRQIFFKDSQSYMDHMAEFGRTTNPYELIASHFRGLARDLAMAESFGRDANGNFGRLLAKAETLDKPALNGKGEVNDHSSLVRNTQRIFDAMMRPQKPGNEFWANAAVQARGVMAASQLGSLVGIMPDYAAMKMAAEFSGLPQMRLFRNVADMTMPGSEKIEFARKAGLWLEGFQHAANLTGMDAFQSGFGSWMNEVTHRAMGLNAADRGMRAGFGLTVMDTLGSFTRRFSTMADAQGESRMLQKYGVNEDHWQVWRAAQPENFRGNDTVLTPQSIHDVPDHVVSKIAENRVAQRSDNIKAEIAKRDAQSVREAGWLQGRIDKFKDAKQRAFDALADLSDNRQQRVENAQGLADARAEKLRAAVQAAEVQHDIAAYLKTETAQDKIQKFLSSVEDGADAERAGDKANNVVQRYGRSVNDAGEALGRRQAQAEARIKEAQRRVDELEKTLEGKTDAKEKALAKKFAGIEKDISEFAQDVQERATRRKEYADEFQKKAGDVIAEEREKLRTEAAVKLMEVAQGEMQFGARGASPSSVADQVAMGLDKTQAGTLAGELHRFALQFKSVPIGIFRNHWIDAAGSMDTAGAKWGYRAKFVAYSALMGALAVELKSMINGQDPRTMNISTPEGRKFWMEATASGGGFGMYGDLFLNGQTAGGSGFEAMLGPGIGAGVNVIKELHTAMEEANKGETNHPYALSGLRWLRKNATPFMNLWYTKAAFNRLVYDQMQDVLAPGSSQKQQMRMERRGVSYWWAPGTTAPQNTPDMSKAFAEH